MPTEPKTPTGGGPGEPDAVLHERLADEIDAIRKRLTDADARQRAAIDARQQALRDGPDAPSDAGPAAPGIPE